MKRFGGLALAALTGLFAVAGARASHAVTPTWGDVATLSPSTALGAQRLCYTDGRDIACDATAPYVSSTTGFVGIRTVTPAYPLDIGARYGGNYANISGYAGNNAAGWRATADSETAVILAQYGSGGTGTLFGINKSRYGVLSTANVAAQNGLMIGTVYGGTLIFGTANIERMRIDSLGNVGIGTITPTANLEVSGTISATNLVINGQPVNGGGGDRIVSTSANVIAYEGGTISFTTGGVSGTAYFDTAGRLIAPGISTTTNQASFTTVYASGLITAGGLNSAGTVSATAGSFRGLAVGMINASGDITTTGAIRAAMLYATGAAINGLAAGAINAAGDITATGVLRGAGVYSTGAITAVGNINTSGTLYAPGASINGLATGYIAGSGDISTTGDVYAANFHGSGAYLTNIPASAITGLVNDGDRITSGTVTAVAQQATGAVQVQGEVNVSGTIKAEKAVVAGNDACTDNNFGAARINPATGRFQLCLNRY